MSQQVEELQQQLVMLKAKSFDIIDAKSQVEQTTQALGDALAKIGEAFKVKLAGKRGQQTLDVQAIVNAAENAARAAIEDKANNFESKQQTSE